MCVGIALFVFQKNTSPSLIIVNTSPTSSTAHNPFSPVVFYFNRPPTENEVVFSIKPRTEVIITASSSSSIVLSPKTMFQPSVTYQITANTIPPFSLQFETEQAENNTPGWNELNSAAHQQYMQMYGSQDEALADIRTNIPIKQPGFEISYSYKNNTYTVSLLAPYESNKSAFLAWIKQKGVSNLNTVRIIYVNKQ